MAVVILGGLVTSTVLNLILMPALYARYSKREIKILDNWMPIGLSSRIAGYDRITTRSWTRDRRKSSNNQNISSIAAVALSLLTDFDKNNFPLYWIVVCPFSANEGQLSKKVIVSYWPEIPFQFASFLMALNVGNDTKTAYHFLPKVLSFYFKNFCPATKAVFTFRFAIITKKLNG